MDRRILLTGATGYVGGRLRGRLEKLGFELRCLVRRTDGLSERLGPRTEVIVGDLLKPATLGRAFAGVDSAYYLVHSMGSTGDFEERDRAAARHFAEAAKEAKLQRVVYLGALGRGDNLSPHLRSRQEVGNILRTEGPAVVELRASIVLGSGSLSFELIRALVERLPVMVTPGWVRIRAQPIAIHDLLDYLVEALEIPLQSSRVYEIGGADRVSYGDLMREYARQRGLSRVMIPVPILSPRLSGLWLGLVTPIYARVGRKLIDSIRHPTVVEDASALDDFRVRPRGMSWAIAAAIRNEDRAFAETHWYDAFSSAGEVPEWTARRLGNRLVESRSIDVEASPERAFAPIRCIGGSTGWYAYDWLWGLRGFLDLMLGGVGVRRGRPAGGMLRAGHALDFWRVEAFDPDRLLRLRAEMRLPGRAWLEFEVKPGSRGSTIRQTAIYEPLGLAGLFYWYLLYPLHRLVFAATLRGIARASTAEGNATAAANAPETD